MPNFLDFIVTMYSPATWIIAAVIFTINVVLWTIQPRRPLWRRLVGWMLVGSLVVLYIYDKIVCAHQLESAMGYVFLFLAACIAFSTPDGK